VRALDRAIAAAERMRDALEANRVMIAKTIDTSRTPDNILGEIVWHTVEIESEAGTIRFATNETGDYLQDVQWDPSDEAWAAIAAAVGS
jgi:hypothetical protein